MKLFQLENSSSLYVVVCNCNFKKTDQYINQFFCCCCCFPQKKENQMSKWLHFNFWVNRSFMKCLKCDLNLETIKSRVLRAVENLQWFAVLGSCPTGLVSSVLWLCDSKSWREGETLQQGSEEAWCKGWMALFRIPSHILTLTSWGHHFSRKCHLYQELGKLSSDT